MSSSSNGSPRFATPTRIDVTDWPTHAIADRARANRVTGSELHLERRGGRTYLVTAPTGR